MKTQSLKINKNHLVLQCSRTCGNWDFRFYSYPNLRLTCSSFCFENSEKMRSKRAWNPVKTDHEYNIVSKRGKNSPRAPKEDSRTPLWRPKIHPRRAQDASRTPPRRLQIVSKARLLLISPSGPQNYSQMASKKAPRFSQNASKTMSILTDRQTDRQRDTQTDR